LDLLVDQSVAILSVARSGLSKTPGIGAKVFSVLSDAKINIDAVCTSTYAISCIIKAEDISKAETSLRQEFEKQ
jgi:aspartokinase